MPRPELACPYCGAPLGTAGPIGRADACPACRKDLHACHACRFHDRSAHNECREPRAEWQPRRDRGNFCDFFELAEAGASAGGGAPGGGGAASGKEADRQRKLDDLFKDFRGG